MVLSCERVLKDNATVANLLGILNRPLLFCKMHVFSNSLPELRLKVGVSQGVMGVS